MRLLAITLLSAMCFGQTNGNGPTVLQSLTLGAASTQSAAPTVNSLQFAAVNSGDLMLACQTDLSDTDTVSYTGTRGETFTAAHVSTGTANNGNSWIAWGVTSSSGTDTITATSTAASNSQFLDSAEIRTPTGVSGWTQDGSAQTATHVHNGVEQSFTISKSATTTVNGSLVIGCGAGGGSQPSWQPQSPNETLVCWGNWNCLTYQFASQPGTYTVTDIVNGGGNGASTTDAALVVIVLKPSAGAITTTILPDAARTVAYSAQLQEVGGVGTGTWSITVGSLPAGLTIGASTGLISGTPSGSTGTSTFTVQWTDGTVTVTKSLNLTVNATAATPTVIQHCFNSVIGGTFLTNPCGSNVTSGHQMWIAFWGMERHQDQGYIPRFVGNTPFTDTFGTVYKGPFGAIGGGMIPIFYFCGVLAGTGAYTVTFTDNQSLGSPRNIFYIEMSGTQCVPDQAVFKSNTPSSASYNLAQSYNPLVNEFVLASGTGYVQLGNSPSLAPNSPLTVISDDSPGDGFGGFFSIAQDTISTSTSLGFAITGATGGGCQVNCELDAISLVGIRPSTSGSFVVSNIRHRAQVY